MLDCSFTPSDTGPGAGKDFLEEEIMQNTIIGIYDSFDQAQGAVNELLGAGFTRANVHLNLHHDSSVAHRADSAPEGREHAGGSTIGHFFRTLFGMHEEEDEHRAHHDIYAEAIRRGSSMLTVNADLDDQCDQAIEIMNRYHPVDMGRRVAQWRSEGWTGYDEMAPAYTASEIESERGRYGAAHMPVIDELLKVGKRVFQRGGVRVFRRAADAPARASAEAREISQEPLVAKEARPLDQAEIARDTSLASAVSDETAPQRGLELDQFGASGAIPRRDVDDTLAASEDADFRTHWQNAYGKAGERYEDYDAAYRYGSSMAANERFENYRWEDAESEMRSDWESRHPDRKWDKVKDAVRYGAEKVTGRSRR